MEKKLELEQHEAFDSLKLNPPGHAESEVRAEVGGASAGVASKKKDKSGKSKKKEVFDSMNPPGQAEVSELERVEVRAEVSGESAMSPRPSVSDSEQGVELEGAAGATGGKKKEKKSSILPWKRKASKVSPQANSSNTQQPLPSERDPQHLPFERDPQEDDCVERLAELEERLKEQDKEAEKWGEKEADLSAKMNELEKEIAMLQTEKANALDELKGGEAAAKRQLKERLKEKADLSAKMNQLEKEIVTLQTEKASALDELKGGRGEAAVQRQLEEMKLPFLG